MTDDGLAEKCIKKDLTDSQCGDDEHCRPYGEHSVCHSEVGERRREGDCTGENIEQLQDVLVQVVGDQGELAANRKTDENNSAARYPVVLLLPSQTSSSSSISLSTFPSTNYDISSKILHTNIALAVNRDLGKKCWCNAGSVYDGTRCVASPPTKYNHQTCETYFTNGFFPLKKQRIVLFFLQFGKISKS